MIDGMAAHRLWIRPHAWGARSIVRFVQEPDNFRHKDEQKNWCANNENDAAPYKEVGWWIIVDYHKEWNSDNEDLMISVSKRNDKQKQADRSTW